MVASLVVLLIAAWTALSAWSTLAVKSEFYDLIGIGDVYGRRWQTTLLLWLVGLSAAAVVAAPLWGLGIAGRSRGRRPPAAGPHPGPDATDADLDAWTARREVLLEWELAHRRRGRRNDGASTRVFLLGWLVVLGLLTLQLGSTLAGRRDGILAAVDRVPFGQADPIFGYDISFHVFVAPLLQAVLGALLTAFLLAGLVAVGAGVAASRAALAGGDGARARALGERTATVGFVYAGLLLLAGAALVWLARFNLLTGGDETIAGAGRAVRDVDIPTRTVAAVVLAGLGLSMLALAVPRLRARAEPSARRAVLVATGIWVGIAVVLAVVATPAWLVLALVSGALGWLLLRAAAQDPEVADLPVPVWTWPALAVVTSVVVTLIGPLGAALYDAVILRGSTFQVERTYIQHTLENTRRATGLDRAETRQVGYVPNGVTREAIEKVPASVGALRILDEEPTLQACGRQQVFQSQYYACREVDVDRYRLGEERRTVYVIGREIDYDRAPDFSRRHFTYTHGRGVAVAPVNIFNRNGRPAWVAENALGLRRPEIYFGAQPDMPWAMVNTNQPVFDQNRNVDKTWEGSTGLRVGSGLDRLALTYYLGGLPYLGGGRSFWNATSGRLGGPDSQVLLFRDIGARARELAPFLQYDSDPYFAVADGRLKVILNAYAATTNYPYSARFGRPGTESFNYVRNAGVVVMDAYTGETTFYAGDEREPILATWRKVYPELFTPMSEMPESLRAHLRFGEDQFTYMSVALERFHVSDVESFFNNNEAWAPTQEAVGTGAQGQREDSPARYTYAVMPDETQEQFLLIRSYKPRTAGRGVGFSAWFAVSNEPETFGQATLLRFPTGAEEPLDSVDTFTSNVTSDPALSQAIETRGGSVQRGHTVVVPVGDGLLYTQPLYLRNPNDPLPQLWQVIVSFGDGEVYAGSNIEEALRLALAGSSAAAGGDGTEGAAPEDATLEDVVRRAATAFEAYQREVAAGNFEAAGRFLEEARRLVRQAESLADRGAGSGETPPDGTTPTETAPTETEPTETAESAAGETASAQQAP
ncbi:MAG: hypothetical protein AVDCRST_MAG79-1943 [uncultured Thermoleophilia bacterium]|uniref:Uncharacterized protein n=1 Tax=uncultured Thermoleophilia bacterium TaxID=1497501 RepID=A0A6J4U5V3_9ACTN|nr:MAG: hypothetical protein AVDCRST_MAG79-1943 [uncultured Thermoleophilia bacterium]